MNNQTSPKTRSWIAVLAGLAGLAVLVFVFNIAISKAIPPRLSQQTVSSSPLITPSEFAIPSAIATQTASPTEDTFATKMGLETSEVQTRAVLAKTPLSFAATIPPLPTGPTETPNYTLGDHQFAGDGIIVFENSLGMKNYPIGVYDFWVDIPRGNKVFAGFTTLSQGAITVEAYHTPIDQPELYLTPRQSGPVKIVDAQGQRLVLRSINGKDTFYFDIPTRKFVDSLTATVAAPTVTLWPTFTAYPTMVIVPTYTLSAIGYPPPPNPTATPIPPQPTSTPIPDPTASALPVQETGTAQP